MSGTVAGDIESASGARKAVLTQRREAAHFFEIQVMSDDERLCTSFDQVKCILVTLSSFSAAGRTGAALDDNDASIAVMPRKEIE